LYVAKEVMMIFLTLIKKNGKVGQVNPPRGKTIVSSKQAKTTQFWSVLVQLGSSSFI